MALITSLLAQFTLKCTLRRYSMYIYTQQTTSFLILKQLADTSSPLLPCVKWLNLPANHHFMPVKPWRQFIYGSASSFLAIMSSTPWEVHTINHIQEQSLSVVCDKSMCPSKGEQLIFLVADYILIHLSLKTLSTVNLLIDEVQLFFPPLSWLLGCWYYHAINLNNKKLSFCLLFARF